MNQGERIMRVADYNAFERTRFFGSLDGLRCVSILGVIWQHTGGQFGGPWTNTLLGAATWEWSCFLSSADF